MTHHEEVPAKRGRKPSPLTGAVANFRRAQAKVTSLNGQVVKWEAKYQGAKGDLENAVVELARYRKELDAALGDVLQ